MDPEFKNTIQDAKSQVLKIQKHHPAFIECPIQLISCPFRAGHLPLRAALVPDPTRGSLPCANRHQRHSPSFTSTPAAISPPGTDSVPTGPSLSRSRHRCHRLHLTKRTSLASPARLQHRGTTREYWLTKDQNGWNEWDILSPPETSILLLIRPIPSTA
jgi:hypothetical protein